MRYVRTMALALMTAAGFVTSYDASAASGDQIFAQRCAVCHAVAGKGGKVGPDLTAVVGRKAAGTTYPYSPALRKLTIKWNPTTLDAFLVAPAKVAPGTRMVVSVSKAEDRAALISYLTAPGK